MPGPLKLIPRVFQTCCSRLASSVSSKPTSALRFQQRSSTKKPKVVVPGQDKGSIVGYSTANEYNLLSLATNLEKQGIYELQPLVEELTPFCVYVKSKYLFNGEAEQEKDIFFFENGSVIFWNVPELERDNVLNFIKSVESERFSQETIYEESELMTFKTDPEVKKSHLQNGTIILSSEPGQSELQQNLTKYAFSNGIAASVRLGTLESALDQIIDSTEHISEDMKNGIHVNLNRQEVLQRFGEIFALRHVLNLSSDLLDTPDFYWDREDLEILYHNICAHLTVAKRTRLMNEKLTYCYELMNLISNHLNDNHHVRLEKFIIALIMIEVFFESIHFIERYFC